jgi:hypothetical protein
MTLPGSHNRRSIHKIYNIVRKHVTSLVLHTSTSTNYSCFETGSNLICRNYVEYETLRPFLIKNSDFWHITPSSPLKANRRFGGKFSLHLPWSKNKPSIIPAWNICLLPVFTPVSCLTYSSTMNIEAKYSSETSVDFQTDETLLYPRKIMKLIMLREVTDVYFWKSYETQYRDL